MKTPLLCSKLALVAATAALLSTAGSARAETIYGLTTTGGLFSFNSATPGTTTAVTAITGVTQGATSLVGMDFRPATGQLFALSYTAATGSSQLYTLNLTTGAATAVGGTFTLQSGIVNGRFGFDFNPTVDRIRAIGGVQSGGSNVLDGPNYRLNPNGSIAGTDTNVNYVAGDANAGTRPQVFGLAYTNNFNGATTTTLYGYDFAIDSLITVGDINGTPNSPNTGQLHTIGASGLTSIDGTFDMDIGATGVAYLDLNVNGNNDNLYTINLATGAATLVGQIGGGIQVLDIAVQVPEPSTYVLMGGALATLLVARRMRGRRAVA